MDTHGSVTEMIDRLRAGAADSKERAAAGVWGRYFDRLLRVAVGRLAPRVRQRVDAEDVVLDAFQTFFARQARGEFDLAGRDELWALLVEIARNKARKAAARATAQKRDVRREVPGGAAGDADDVPDWLAAEPAADPTPEEAAAMTDELERLFALLPADLRTVAALRMEGHTHEEIAARLGVVVRTVERKVDRIRQLWADAGAGGAAD